MSLERRVAAMEARLTDLARARRETEVGPLRSLSDTRPMNKVTDGDTLVYQKSTGLWVPGRFAATAHDHVHTHPVARLFIGAAGQPAFQNGWSPNWGANTVWYAKDDKGFVHIGGSVGRAPEVRGSLNYGPAFTLPVGFRPPGSGGSFAVSSYGSVSSDDPAMYLGTVQVSSDGTVWPVKGSSNIVWLNQLSFYVG